MAGALQVELEKVGHYRLGAGRPRLGAGHRQSHAARLRHYGAGHCLLRG
jgi:cobalamin biosynthesis protein CobD/CbiB